jgi:hypothetical protein
MTTQPRTPSSSLRRALSRMALPARSQANIDSLSVKRESRSRFFYVVAVLFTAATVAALFTEQPARVYLLGAVLSYGFAILITTVEDLLELLNAYWAARSAAEWEDYASSVSGRRSWVQNTIVRGTDQVFGPIGNDRDIIPPEPFDRRVLDHGLGDKV